MQTNKQIEGMTKHEQERFESQALLDLQDLIYVLSPHHPFYGTIFSKFIKRIRFDIPVAAVTFEKGHPVLLINPIGFGSYSRKEQIFILIHEMLHIVNQHHLRGRGKDPAIFNIAADISINQMIESSIAYRPNDCLMPHHFDLEPNLSTEEYYNQLIARDEPIELPKELQNSLLSDIVEGDGSEGGDGQGQGQGKQPGDGQGGGKGDKGTPDFGKLHPNWKEVQAMGDDLVKGLTKGLVQEAMIKNAGNIPGELKEAIEALFEPQVEWDRVLRSFTTSLLSTKSRSTWSRPNRRMGSVKMGRLRKKELNLLVAIDTSGSLSTNELTLFLSEIKGIRDQTEANITIVQCDTNIRSVQKFNEIDIDNFEVFGRGGTSLIPPFELVSDRERDGHQLSESIDGVIYLTDGYGEAPVDQTVRTMWVISPGGRLPYTQNNQDVDWGQSVYLNDGNKVKQQF
jgi:predicted metal-dependent peptidase